MSLSPHPQPNPKAEHEYVDPPRAVFRAFNPWKATLQECLVARYSIDNKEDPFPGTLNFGWWKTTITFLTDWLPRRIFINLLLHIPSIYISRFEAAINKEGLSFVDMKQLAHEESITRIRRESPLFKIEFRTGCLFGGYHVRDLGWIYGFWIQQMPSKPHDPVILAFIGFLGLFCVIMYCRCMVTPAIPLPTSRRFHPYRTNIYAYWDFKIAMELQDIHKPVYQNSFVDLSIEPVWMIW